MGSKAYRDTFRSTGWHYARFRRGYPDALFELLRQKFGLDGTGRLLDLGCGTGQLAMPLAREFEEVVAMDPEPEMLSEAVALGRGRGIANIVWREAGSADLEDLWPALGAFRLVTMGNSFPLDGSGRNPPDPPRAGHAWRRDRDPRQWGKRQYVDPPGDPGRHGRGRQAVVGRGPAGGQRDV